MMYELPATDAEGQARLRALENVQPMAVKPTSLVSYLSRGRLLIIGDETEVLAAGSRVADTLLCTGLVAVEDAQPKVSDVGGMTLIRGGAPELTGNLGSFRLALNVGGEAVPLEGLLGQQDTGFDIVLDLGQRPLFTAELLPPGYLAPGNDPEALSEAIESLPELTGEFEKPKFFNYNLDICAHGNSGLEGCRRCIDACPAEAIISVGDRIEVNPGLCQGAGSCATACPTGAITYAYPTVSDLLRHVRGLLGEYRKADGVAPALLFHDSGSAEQVEARLAAGMPERLLPVMVEEIGSVGMEAWMSCLAYGATGVVLAGSATTPMRVIREIDAQIKHARAILAGMGYADECVQRIDIEDEDATAASINVVPQAAIARPAKFEAPDEKRTILKFSIEHLYAQAPTKRRSAALSAGAPFGEIRVDKNACTLCMSCVGVCPASAVRDGQGLPQLNFHEWSCVQCGLCEAACPEDAITLNPRFVYDSKQREETRTLHEEQPFCCISCGKPFATQSMLDVMTKKLAGHWMFQSDDAMRRLKMCDHCRVKDMMKSQSPPGSA
jgi:ferredoxin